MSPTFGAVNLRAPPVVFSTVLCTLDEILLKSWFVFIFWNTPRVLCRVLYSVLVSVESEAVRGTGAVRQFIVVADPRSPWTAARVHIVHSTE